MPVKAQLAKSKAILEKDDSDDEDIIMVSKGSSKQEYTNVDMDDSSILAPPIDSSDESDSKSGFIVDIQMTKFGSREPTQEPPASKVVPSRASMRRTINEKPTTASFPSRSQRSSSNIASQTTRKGSPKRKSQEDVPEISELGKAMLRKKEAGRGMQGSMDIFGNPVRKKRKPSSQTYVKSSQGAKSSSQANIKKGSQETILDSDDETMKPFVKPESTPDVPDSKDEVSPTRRKKFKKPKRDFDSPPASPVSPQKPFLSRKFSAIKAIEEDEEEFPAFNKPSSSFGKDFPSDPPVQKSKRESMDLVEEPAATQYQAFRRIEFLDDLAGDDLAEVIEPILKDRPSTHINSTFDDDFLTTQVGRCPMCNGIVDPDDLRALGNMNTRQQEKFCRSHQKKTAQLEMASKYPEIAWENLDQRIKSHHALIEKIVNGRACFYRSELDEKVKAGKDRNLLKMTSNLTPGYYGSRGLREISEAIMKKFTPLLKKRGVTDRLMAARGVTGFVQAVLVPEVTALLIMEDMSVDVVEARKILAESVSIGELVHEEIRDVVTGCVDDSEDDGFDD